MTCNPPQVAPPTRWPSSVLGAPPLWAADETNVDGCARAHGRERVDWDRSATSMSPEVSCKCLSRADALRACAKQRRRSWGSKPFKGPLQGGSYRPALLHRAAATFVQVRRNAAFRD